MVSNWTDYDIGFIFCFFCLLYWKFNLFRLLKIPYVSDTGELVIICASLIGAGLGFLWFNAPPAMVFMVILAHYQWVGPLVQLQWRQNMN